MARMTGKDRKRQIAETALDLLATDGVQGATNARIAQAAGITAAAMYRHFDDRNQVLLAALDSLYARIRRLVLDSSQESNVLERLRAIGHVHSDLISSEQGTFVYPFVEFLAAPREAGLREAQAVKQMEMIRSVAATVEEGKAQGTIRPDVDSEQVSWELHALWWAEDIAYVMGLSQFVTAGRSTTLLNQLLDRIANRPHETVEPSELEQIRKLLRLCPAVAADLPSADRPE
jgi:TetR/AcrR family transcriptional regulator, transcriptional repressor for nem operon